MGAASEALHARKQRMEGMTEGDRQQQQQDSTHQLFSEGGSDPFMRYASQRLTGRGLGSSANGSQVCKGRLLCLRVCLNIGMLH